MDLIKRLEEAPEGSRELDCRIFLFTKGMGDPIFHIHTDKSLRDNADFLIFDQPNGKEGYCSLSAVPHYTTSLDAALTLVPEGCAITLNLKGRDHHYTTLFPVAGGQAFVNITAPTPALAVCIAALKARQNDAQG